MSSLDGGRDQLLRKTRSRLRPALPDTASFACPRRAALKLISEPEATIPQRAGAPLAYEITPTSLQPSLTGRSQCLFPLKIICAFVRLAAHILTEGPFYTEPEYSHVWRSPGPSTAGPGAIESAVQRNNRRIGTGPDACNLLGG